MSQVNFFGKPIYIWMDINKILIKIPQYSSQFIKAIINI